MGVKWVGAMPRVLPQVLHRQSVCLCVQVTSGSKGLRGGSPVGPGYYTNLPSAFDKVLKKPASKIYGETCGHLPHLP